MLLRRPWLHFFVDFVWHFYGMFTECFHMYRMAHEMSVHVQQKWPKFSCVCDRSNFHKKLIMETVFVHIKNTSQASCPPCKLWHFLYPPPPSSRLFQRTILAWYANENGIFGACEKGAQWCNTFISRYGMYNEMSAGKSWVQHFQTLPSGLLQISDN